MSSQERLKSVHVPLTEFRDKRLVGQIGLPQVLRLLNKRPQIAARGERDAD